MKAIKKGKTVVQSKLKYYLLIFVFGALLTTSAFGQALSLKMCLQRVEQASFVLKAAQQQTQVIKKEVGLEKAKNLPQLFGVFSAERHNLSAYGFYQQNSLLLADWAFGSFLLKTEGIKHQEALASEQKRNALRLQIDRRVVRLFFEALNQEKMRVLLNERLKRLQVHRQVAEALWQAGNKTELDVLQTEARLLQLEEAIQRALNQQQKVLKELAVLIDWPTGQPLELQSIDTQRLEKGSLPLLQESLWQNHPQLQMLHLKQEAVRLSRKAVRAAQWPHVQVSGGFAVDRDPTGDGNYWLASVGLSLPLFRWNTTGLELQKLQAQQSELQNEQAAWQRRLSIEAQQLLIDLKHLRRILELQSKRLQKSEQALKLAQANYKAGLITNLEFLAVQEQYSKAEIDLQSTQLEFAEQLAQFYLLTNQGEKLERW